MDYVRSLEAAQHAVDAALRGEAPGVCVPTSGTGGAPRDVYIGADALRSSAQATHEALAGPGRWLLATPPERIAGVMVLVRSAMAGTSPVTMPSARFTAEGFVKAAQSLGTGSPRYTSLVPTQLARVLDSPAGAEALSTFDAVLVGGAAVNRPSLPANVIETYGMTETCGGCVYRGLPIGSASVRVVDGRIHVSGPMLADGYATGDDPAWLTEDGVRWFVTSDLGEIDARGALRVLGRADDVIVTGGMKVHPGPVAEALTALDWVAEAVVVGVPDPEWGERVVAVVAPKPGAQRPPWASVRERLAAMLPREAVPRTGVLVGSLPRLESGKIDRAAARDLAAGA